MKADCLLVDLRDIPAMHQLGHAQEILDRMGRGYEHQMDWPVAPILILTDSIDPSELQISEHLTREVRFHHKVVFENVKDGHVDLLIPASRFTPGMYEIVLRKKGKMVKQPFYFN
jgi:hypothetical protein